MKYKYYSKVTKKILDPSTSPKTYWSILKTFLNNKKIPVIPSILHDKKYITDFKQKAEVFNSHFSKQLINNSKIPSEYPQKSNESLPSITFEINDNEKIIKNLDPKNLMAMICSVFACWNCMVNPLTNLWILGWQAVIKKQLPNSFTPYHW